MRVSTGTQQTQGIHQMLFQCWAIVKDGGPTLKQYWVNSWCLLGSRSHYLAYVFRILYSRT